MRMVELLPLNVFLFTLKIRFQHEKKPPAAHYVVMVMVIRRNYVEVKSVERFLTSCL